MRLSREASASLRQQLDLPATANAEQITAAVSAAARTQRRRADAAARGTRQAEQSVTWSADAQLGLRTAVQRADDQAAAGRELIAATSAGWGH